MATFDVRLHQPGVYNPTTGKAVTYTLYEVGSGDSDYLLNATLKLEVNKAGTFEFDILPSHSYYSILRRYVQYISVREFNTGVPVTSLELPDDVVIDDEPVTPSPDSDSDDTHIIFYGRILSIALSFNGIKHVVCEGLMANLLDCPMYCTGHYHDGMTAEKIFTVSGTPETMFKTAINAYRNLLRTDIILGTINDSADSYTFEDIDVSNGTSVGDFITSELVEAHGGFLRMYYREWAVGDITGVLCWDPDPTMSDYSEPVLNQSIEFGENMLDISGENEDDEISSGIVPEWEDANNEKKWVATTGIDVDGIGEETIYKPYVVGSVGSLDSIGIQVVDLPGTKTQEKAIGYAQTYVEKYCDHDLANAGFDSYTVRAIDFHYLDDDDKQRIWLYNRVRLQCSPLGIDQTLMCTSMEISLDNPENTSYTLSVFHPKASSNDKTLARQLKRKRF